MHVDPRERYFRGLLLLLIAAGGFFGLAPLVLPTQFADLSGFSGQDVFMYRLAGAATFGYAVGLAAGFRSEWRVLRIPIAATFVFNAASIAACLVAIVGGGAQPVVFLILAASVLFTAGTGYFLARPLISVYDHAGVDRSPDLAPWVTALFAIGAVAALFFGLAALIPPATLARSWGTAAWTTSSTARAERRRSARASAGRWCSCRAGGSRPASRPRWR